MGELEGKVAIVTGQLKDLVLQVLRLSLMKVPRL